jgi:hypothetical protein
LLVAAVPALTVVGVPEVLGQERYRLLAQVRYIPSMLAAQALAQHIQVMELRAVILTYKELVLQQAR